MRMIPISQHQASFDLGLFSMPTQPIAITPEIECLLDKNAVIAIGISGGKDSDCVAIAMDAYLNEIGYQGKRLLIHADLGRVEWKDSLPSCERLAAKIGWELVVVRREAGDMLARWEGRWEANADRYANLRRLKLTLPWSTPSLRFCTSELKTQVITSELRKRYKGVPVINITGVRRQESSNRAKMPVSGVMPKLQRKDAEGYFWNPIIEWPVEQVFQTIADAGLKLHEAYTEYGASRVSCAFCIMSAAHDLRAAAGCADNHDLYRSMVNLEIRSTFGFQESAWLADTAPHLLSSETLKAVERSKLAALKRQALEKTIPTSLMLESGIPLQMPTLEEAQLLADVRRQVGELVRINVGYVTAADVLDRYAEMLHFNPKVDTLDSSIRANNFACV